MKKKSKDILVVAILYTLIFIVYTFPLILKFDNAFVGDLMGDASQFFWNAYHFKKSFPDVCKILYTNDILYPEGVSLLVNSNTYIYGIAGLFSKNSYLSFNIIVALSFILSGVAAYLLCRKYIDNKFLCALAGFIFAFSPYKLIRLTGHYNLLLTFTIPLIFICFAKIVTLKDDKINFNFDKKNCLIFFGLFGFTLLLDYVVVFHALYLCAAYLFALVALTIKWKKSKTQLIIIGVSSLVVVHFIIRGLRLLGVDDRGAFWWGNDSASFFIPSYNSLFYKNIDPSIWFHQHPEGIESVMFLGYTFILLSFFAFVFYIRNFQYLSVQLKLLFITCIVLCMLSIPSMKILGKEIFNMPTSSIHFIPFFNNVRIAGRIIMLISLILPILSLYYLDKKIKQRYSLTAAVSAANISAVIIGFLLFIEFFPAKYEFTKQADIPNFVYKIENNGNSILNIPFGIKDGNKMLGQFECKNLFYQTVYHAPILDGYTSRIKDKVFLAYQENTIANELLNYSKDTTSQFNALNNKLSEYISENAIGYIIISPSHRNRRFESVIEAALMKKYNKLNCEEEEGYKIIKLKL